MISQTEVTKESPAEVSARLRCARCTTCWGRGVVTIRLSGQREAERVACACMKKPRTPPMCRHPLVAYQRQAKQPTRTLERYRTEAVG